MLRTETQLGLSQLVGVELFSAVSRRLRMGEISQGEARRIVERFETDLDSGFYTQISLEPLHYQQARDWIGRFETPLRTLDALHLVIAVSNNLCLVTADEALAGSAEAKGAIASSPTTAIALLPSKLPIGVTPSPLTET